LRPGELPSDGECPNAEQKKKLGYFSCFEPIIPTPKSREVQIPRYKVVVDELRFVKLI
jgi:hypothetical protein